jgi:DNA-binding MarR family transcriptional regulator
MRSKSTKKPALRALPCACATLRRASRAVTHFYSQAMLDSGLEITQFTLLQVLHRAGPLTQGRLGRVLAMDSTTLSRSLRPLRKNGLVAADRGHDRRERHWRLTLAGALVLKRSQPFWRKAQSQLRRTLGEAGWKTLMDAADAATRAAGSL